MRHAREGPGVCVFSRLLCSHSRGGLPKRSMYVRAWDEFPRTVREVLIIFRGSAAPFLETPRLISGVREMSQKKKTSSFSTLRVDFLSRVCACFPLVLFKRTRASVVSIPATCELSTTRSTPNFEKRKVRSSAGTGFSHKRRVYELQSKRKRLVTWCES